MGGVYCESVLSRANSFHEEPEIRTDDLCAFDLGDAQQERFRIKSRSFGSASASSKKTKSKKKNQVLLEGYVETPDEDLTRTKSLTDEDLDELKGCLDLGFGFSYDEIPELCNTLPALELCYSMSQKFMDEHQKSPESSPEVPPSPADSCSSTSSSVANWKISSPGDHPEDVKARLKFWAQAVACTVRLCN
ncbi:hypothetical protein QN277_027412 [Acacia crassicarpa]|uniref:Uncharacterized protein n=1 Tax=Acacia crassicarpa TaxID=499986 RepID=A0AAE1J9Z0_9FABA|nr:hypothetical protein QN277_027412 [Acacia crassicarpa]